MSRKIPDRWLDYTAVGDRIEGTRFIAFKVPLKPQLTDADNRFDGKILLEKVPNLGIIIDLTNTNRYYDPRCFENEGVRHQKLMIPGHVTPPQRLVDKFKEYVKEFLQNNPDNDKLIGVHCTHGVNRTGFLICNYMVSEMSIAPNDAIEKFAKARGHKIERHNYLDALQRITGDPDDTNDTSNTETTALPMPTSPANANNRQSHHSPERSSWKNTTERDRVVENLDRRNANYHRNVNDRPPPPKMPRRFNDAKRGRRYRDKNEGQSHRRPKSGFQNFEFRGLSAITYGINDNGSSSHGRTAHPMYGYPNGPNNSNSSSSSHISRFEIDRSRNNDRYHSNSYSRERPDSKNRSYARDRGERQRSISAGRRQGSHPTNSSYQNRR
ncbi:RNA/RNP complex-1-interacting phosphatase isoform X2 [Musca domestica]|uniref:RNA/RNP complex-1-interacting phosphatase isoform X2 n=1 Tax=Musca domestica TaxID=7370 RepID=A0ABM3V8X3_MUSDO|nr:RNA/RNP complex-1-interacting phosphatase isoform X2 [Musca domestica]